jgi:hypothetical protein
MSERRDSLGSRVDHAVLVLQRPFNTQTAAACHDDAVAFKEFRRDDGVGNSGFVFKRQQSSGSARQAPRDQPRNSP